MNVKHLIRFYHRNELSVETFFYRRFRELPFSLFARVAHPLFESSEEWMS